MTPRLQRALDDVDRVFGAFICAADNPCTHCYGDDGVPELKVSGAQIDRATLRLLAYEAPSILADHEALVRRILPQVARGMADGTVHTYWADQHCLTRCDWRGWPAPQPEVITEFVAAWWADLITTPDPHHSITDAFATFAALSGDVGAALAAWPDHSVANHHLVTASSVWLHDLVHDDDPLYLLLPDGPAPVVQAMSDWYIDVGADRLRRTDDELAGTVALLTLPVAERMSRLYGAAAPGTPT
ncbi:hypothetical protein [Promicromonospora sp. NPDC057488]|uniref:hypothetical protein n=1 Tax=Promicromonospora sp. NPDC057488 TaxID=3346147 RepID=UPI00366B268C